MSENLENKIETGHESGGETTGTEEQPPTEQVVKEVETANAAASKPQSPAKKAEKTKKTTAIDEIMTSIKNMTVLELAELVKTLETEFGVTAAAPVVATAAAPVEAAAPAEEKTEFDVILKEVGSLPA